MTPSWGLTPFGTMPQSDRTSTTAVISTTHDISRGCRSLRRRCQHMRAIHDLTGDPPLRRHEAGFRGLARIVVGQQLSIASAAAIWKKVCAGIDPLEPCTVLKLDEPALRALGLSRPKIKTLKSIAEASVSGAIDFSVLPALGEVGVREKLTAISGIGPWSADIYQLFCLGTQDAFAPGDLALREAVRHATGIADRPGPAEILLIADTWRPWRGVAARLLWTYYAEIKRKGPPTARHRQPGT